MTYSPTDWTDGSTPVNAANLDKIEAGIANAYPRLVPTPLVEGRWLKVQGGAMVWADIGAEYQALSAKGQGNGYASLGADGKVPAAQLPTVGGVVTLAVFSPLHNEPPAANFATLDTRNSQAVLDFDAAVDESAVFRGVLNRGYVGAGLTIKLIWAATTAVAGTCRWGVQFERVQAGAQDLDVDSFAAAKTAGGVADATSGETTETEIAFTNAEIDGLLVGEMFRLKVYRDADGTSGTDDMTGDAELVAVELRNS